MRLFLTFVFSFFVSVAYPYNIWVEGGLIKTHKYALTKGGTPAFVKDDTEKNSLIIGGETSNFRTITLPHQDQEIIDYVNDEGNSVLRAAGFLSVAAWTVPDLTNAEAIVSSGTIAAGGTITFSPGKTVSPVIIYGTSVGMESLADKSFSICNTDLINPHYFIVIYKVQ